MSKKVYLKTLGCQMNERDSEFIAGLFLEKGYGLCDSPKEADIILFNTCSVREHAEERAVNSIRQLMHKHKNRIYGVVGCAAQALKGKLFERLPELNIVCGTGEIARLPELVRKAINSRETKTEKSSGGLNTRYILDNLDTSLPELNPSYRQSGEHAYVSIMRGCDNFCSYCIVPHVRGRERSRKAGDIINEIEELAERGIKKITLLGQNVNSYRPEHATNRYNFVNLLRDVNKLKGIVEINFMTSHPKDANVELFKAMKDSDKIAKHLHLPLQSGSDRILKLMNRGYMKKKYLELIKKARDIIPGLRLTTDIIVGFPTETEEDFNDTLNLMKEVKFGMAYIFKYSPRAGTEAAKLKDDVPPEVKVKRHEILLDLQRKIYKRKTHEKTHCYSVGQLSCR
jgi:tRNA-2-methylthio-N6-dimethylallyladenosine synthase